MSDVKEEKCAGGREEFYIGERDSLWQGDFWWWGGVKHCEILDIWLMMLFGLYGCCSVCQIIYVWGQTFNVNWILNVKASVSFALSTMHQHQVSETFPKSCEQKHAYSSVSQGLRHSCNRSPRTVGQRVMTESVSGGGGHVPCLVRHREWADSGSEVFWADRVRSGRGPTCRRGESIWGRRNLMERGLCSGSGQSLWYISEV